MPVVFFFYAKQPNYMVDITDVAQQKAKAAAAHTSQFGTMVTSYDENKLAERREGLAKFLLASPVRCPARWPHRGKIPPLDGVQRVVTT